MLRRGALRALCASLRRLRRPPQTPPVQVFFEGIVRLELSHVDNNTLANLVGLQILYNNA
jgi:hypothetical protein